MLCCVRYRPGDPIIDAEENAEKEGIWPAGAQRDGQRGIGDCQRAIGCGGDPAADAPL